MRIAVSVSEKEKARHAQSPYVQALLAAGAEGSEIELVSISDAPRVRAGDYDGILFTGGEDVDPSFYGEKKQHESVHVASSRARGDRRDCHGHGCCSDLHLRTCGGGG